MLYRKDENYIKLSLMMDDLMNYPTIGSSVLLKYKANTNKSLKPILNCVSNISLSMFKNHLVKYS